MSIEITMPRLSDTMEMGTVIKWNVKEGDAVEPGDVIADIETDKATMELQAYDEGAVAKIIADEGQSMPVGATILVLAEEGEDPSSINVKDNNKKQSDEKKPKSDSEEPDKGKKSKRDDDDSETNKEQGKAKAESRPGGDAGSQETDSKAAPERSTPPSGKTNGRVAASPLARKIAESEGLDLSNIKGTGPGGRIVRKDVEAAVRRGASAPAQASPSPVPEAPAPEARLEARDVELSNMRRTIARRLVESKTTIPHYQVTVTVNMDPLLELRAQLNEQLESQGVKLSVNDFLVRACALALHKHPYVNASWVDEGGEGRIRIHGDVNIGVAVALSEERGGGLVVATLRDADSMGLRSISAETKRLANKAREKGLTIDEMEGATFTLSNLGMFGVEHFTAIINPPNSAILAVGAAVEKPVVRDGQVVIGHEMQMTMSSDHRVIDGAMAARYLGDVREALEHPATLLV